MIFYFQILLFWNLTFKKHGLVKQSECFVQNKAGITSTFIIMCSFYVVLNSAYTFLDVLMWFAILSNNVDNSYYPLYIKIYKCIVQ